MTRPPQRRASSSHAEPSQGKHQPSPLSLPFLSLSARWTLTHTFNGRKRHAPLHPPYPSASPCGRVSSTLSEQSVATAAPAPHQVSFTGRPEQNVELSQKKAAGFPNQQSVERLWSSQPLERCIRTGIQEQRGKRNK
uniref:Uncharacterized protein n=1 Tax=Knipowitschia caucasica TaxID=637954 RepID=A0AAV2JQ71_KNICA